MSVVSPQRASRLTLRGRMRGACCGSEFAPRSAGRRHVATERAAVGGWRPVSRQCDGAGCRRLHGRHAARARCVRWWRWGWEVGATGRTYPMGEVLPVSTRPRRAKSSVGLRNTRHIAVPGAVEAPRVNDGAWLVRLHRRRKFSRRSAKAGFQRHCARAAGGAWTDGFAPGRGEEPRAACWSLGHRAAKGVAVACSLCRVGAGRLGDSPGCGRKAVYGPEVQAHRGENVAVAPVAGHVMEPAFFWARRWI